MHCAKKLSKNNQSSKALEKDPKA